MTSLSVRAQSIFISVIALDNSQRTAYLDRACLDDPDLLTEVRTLLAAYDALGDFLECPPIGQTLIKLLPSALGEDKLPVIVDYEDFERIGVGGMAEVFRAKQLRPLRRTVALKRLRPGLNGREFAARFALERQALALMAHPHIAKVFDLGEDDDGRPFYTMEYVDGAPIDAYCQSRDLDLLARLSLFEKVCDAMAHAHGKLIIHRDLKPSNILICGESGLPKIIDFGIAKTLCDLEGLSFIGTRRGVYMGTPPFMSPEQTTGDPVDIRTDVYALGVLLFVLVSDTVPFEAPCDEASLQTVLRRIREEEPPRPSSLLGSGKSRFWRARLREDLDWVVLRAMAKDPERRYLNVQALGEDVRRVIRNLPVKARRPAKRYFALKFIQRRRTFLMSAAVFLIGLTATITAVGVGNRRTLSERVLSQSYAIMMEDVLAMADPRVLDPAMPLAEAIELLTEHATPEDERAQAYFFRTLGRGALGRGEYHKGHQLLERALSLYSRNFGSRHRETLSTAYSYGMAELYLNQKETSIQLLNETWLTQVEELGPLDADTLLSESGYLKALNRFRVEDVTDRFLDLHHRYRQWLGSRHPDLEHVLRGIADVYQRKGAFEKAEFYYRKLFAFRKEIYPERHPYVINAENLLANNLYWQSRYSEALILAENAWGQARDVLSESHPYSMSLMNNLANIFDALKRPEEAELYYRRLLAMRERYSGPRHEQTLIVMNNLASLLSSRGVYEEAKALKLREIGIYTDRFGPRDSKTLFSRITLGEVILARGDAEGAWRHFLNLFVDYQEAGVSPAEAALVQSFWARAALALDEFDIALGLASAAHLRMKHLKGGYGSYTRDTIRQILSHDQCFSQDRLEYARSLLMRQDTNLRN